MSESKKDQELVLVIPKDCLVDLGLPGVLVTETHPQRQNKLIEMIAKGLFQKRGIAEESKTHVQPIPYVVVVNEKEEFLVYNRGKKGGERRLADKWSIGVGGHVNPEDQRITGSYFSLDDLMTAVQRELQEELVGLSETSKSLESLRPVGVFYNEDTPVNAVHLGILFVIRLKNGEFRKMGDGVQKFKWATQEELTKMTLEPWSQTALDVFVPREVQAPRASKDGTAVERESKHQELRRGKQLTKRKINIKIPKNQQKK